MSARTIHVVHHSNNIDPLLHSSSPGVAICDFGEPLPSETVTSKSVNSTFVGTRLEDETRASDIRRLVNCGLATDHCVSTTVRMAANLGVIDTRDYFGGRRHCSVRQGQLQRRFCASSPSRQSRRRVSPSEDHERDPARREKLIVHFYKLALVVRFPLVDRFCLFRSFTLSGCPSVYTCCRGTGRNGKEEEGKGKGGQAELHFKARVVLHVSMQRDCLREKCRVYGKTRFRRSEESLTWPKLCILPISILW